MKNKVDKKSKHLDIPREQRRIKIQEVRYRELEFLQRLFIARVLLVHKIIRFAYGTMQSIQKVFTCWNNKGVWKSDWFKGNLFIQYFIYENKVFIDLS